MSEIDTRNVFTLEVEANLEAFALKIEVLTPALLSTFFTQPQVGE